MLTLQGLKIAWIYAKKYAWIVFAAIAAILAYVLFRKADTPMADAIDAINARHQAELDAIAKAEAEREAERSANDAKYAEALRALEAKYLIDTKALDSLKASEIERLKALPMDVLAAELAKAYGFQVL